MNKDLDEFISTTQQIWRFIHSNSKKKFWMHDKGTPLQFFALRFLMQNPDATIKDLTERFQITKSSATQLIERLHKQGLIGKATDKNDRRVTHLKLTKKAEKILLKMRKERDGEMRKIFSRVSSEDLRELVRIHLTLLKNLKEEKS